MKTIEVNLRVEKLEKAIFYALCGFSFSLCISMAIGNIFLGFVTLLTLIRLIYKHDDIAELWRNNIVVPTIGCFLTVMLITVFASGDFVVSLKQFFEHYIYRMMPLLAILLFIRDLNKVMFLGILLVISFFITDIYAIYQGIQGNLRASGFFGHPMTFAGFSVILMPAYFLMLVSRAYLGRFKIAMPALTLLALLAVLFNGTRGAWIALAVAVPVSLVPCIHNWKKAMISFGVAILCFVILFVTVPQFSKRINSIFDQSYQSNTERILLWQSAWNMFKDHPFLGVGPERFKDEYQNTYMLPEAKEPGLGHAHNNFLQMLSETGSVGLIAFCSLMGSIFYTAISTWRKDQNISALIMFGTTLGLILQGLTEYNFGNSAVMKMYWLVIALCMQMMSLEKRGEYR